MKVYDDLKKINYPAPDSDDICWTTGDETFTREEVAYLLYSQRAIVFNTINSIAHSEEAVRACLRNLRQPKF